MLLPTMWFGYYTAKYSAALAGRGSRQPRRRRIVMSPTIRVPGPIRFQQKKTKKLPFGKEGEKKCFRDSEM